MHLERLCGMEHYLETEYKFLLSKNEFVMIEARCDELELKKSQYVQINYYYDTEDNVYFKNNTTIRIRQIENALKMQIKQHRSTNSEFRLSEEYEKEVEQLPRIVDHPDTSERLICKGFLVTERKEYLFGNNIRVYLDHNLYLGISDYEVEVEFEAPDLLMAQRIVNDLKLTEHSEYSKSSRFFRYYLMRNF